MINNQILSNAEQYAKEIFAGEASGHDFWHTLRVSRVAARLAETEGADRNLCVLAALLHDVDDAKISPATTETLSNAVSFMTEQKVSPANIDKICRIIRQISFKGTDSVRPDTIEGMIVQDADRLDAIGAIGIARTFAFGGSRGRAIYDPDSPPVSRMDEKAYRANKGSSINHFYEKLLLLKDMMNTPSARRLADHRHRVIEDFLTEFMLEWNGEDSHGTD